MIDLDLEVDVARDAIENTADYRAITDAVRDVVEGASFDLIESMAGAVAGRGRPFRTPHPPPRWCTSRTRRPGSASTAWPPPRPRPETGPGRPMAVVAFLGTASNPGTG